MIHKEDLDYQKKSNFALDGFNFTKERVIESFDSDHRPPDAFSLIACNKDISSSCLFVAHIELSFDKKA